MDPRGTMPVIGSLCIVVKRKFVKILGIIREEASYKQRRE
jgi:hypothetical protein